METKKIAQIIILSDSKTPELKKVTENCLKSLKMDHEFNE